MGLPFHCDSAEEGSVGCKQQKKVSKEFIDRKNSANFRIVLKAVVFLTVAAQNGNILHLHLL